MFNIASYQEGFTDGFADAKKKYERPRGKWLTDKVAFHLTCPFCTCNLYAVKTETFEGNYQFNFCPHCGADMRGKEE